jgi:hypothetical protein
MGIMQKCTIVTFNPSLVMLTVNGSNLPFLSGFMLKSAIAIVTFPYSMISSLSLTSVTPFVS